MSNFSRPEPANTRPNPPADLGLPIIEIRGLTVGFGERLIMDGLDLAVRKGEILGVVGASGTGKSVLLRTIIGLVHQRKGSVRVFGHDMASLTPVRRRLIERRWGVLFQHGALFSSLTVRQNIQFPMREYLDLSEDLLDEMVLVKLRLVGLEPEAAERFPSELSGGMIKRVALARALALDPEIVFLDEPTSGLDPIGAADFDTLIATLQKTLGLTVFMVTHDLDSLAGICDRIAALGDGKVLHTGPLDEMKQQTHPWLQAYFNGSRARASQVHKQPADSRS
jgi:phospholipid/cholesterol/gamma-HCH transport system ATP-binding protein